MILYIVLSVGLFFSIIAGFSRVEGRASDSLLITCFMYSLMFAVARLNQSLSNSISPYDKTPILVLEIIALITYLVYQFRQTDVKWM